MTRARRILWSIRRIADGRIVVNYVSRKGITELLKALDVPAYASLAVDTGTCHAVYKTFVDWVSGSSACIDAPETRAYVLEDCAQVNWREDDGNLQTGRIDQLRWAPKNEVVAVY